MDKLKVIAILTMIRADLKSDLNWAEGRELTGKTVATMFGRQAAAIDAIANILTGILKGEEDV